MISVCIVIPVYNVESHIEQCLYSVMAQDHPQLQCMLLNDCSTDDSMGVVAKVLGKYDGPIRFQIFNLTENKGAAVARNIGMQSAAADYIYFLDGDDALFPGTISDMVQHVQQHPGLDMVQGEMYCEDPQLQRTFSITNKNFPAYTADPIWLKNHFLMDVPVSPCNKLVNLRFLRYNEIYFEPGLLHEDILWRFKLGKFIKSIAFTKHVGYKYTLNNNSVMTAPANDLRRIHSQMVIIEYMLEHLCKYFAAIESLSLLRQFYYARSMKVLDENKAYRDKMVKEDIMEQLQRQELSPMLRMGYRLLLSDSFLKYGSWLWNKYMGLMFRIVKKQTRTIVERASMKPMRRELT